MKNIELVTSREAVQAFVESCAIQEAIVTKEIAELKGKLKGNSFSAFLFWIRYRPLLGSYTDALCLSQAILRKAISLATTLQQNDIASEETNNNSGVEH